MARFLLAPLDWGLGHASRCIPLARLLTAAGHEVMLGVCEGTRQLLQAELPACRSLEIPAYNPVYPDSDRMIAAMARQLPSFLSVIRSESAVAKRLAAAEKIDVIISDNRYGFRAPGCLNLFLGHQLHIRMPEGAGAWSPIVNSLNRRLLKAFDQVLIPDFEGYALSGSLARTHSVHGIFIGPLSRFDPSADYRSRPNGRYLAILSGPEPQRSNFERILLDYFKRKQLNASLVRGTQSVAYTAASKNIHIYDLLGAAELADLVRSHQHIICRSGYSSIMDLLAMGRTATLVPTPGQTEQEYLADYHSQNGLFTSCRQDAFQMESGIRTLEDPEALVQLRGEMQHTNAADRIEQLLTTAPSG